MAQRPMRFLLLVAAFGLVLPGCAQWGSWFSASKPASPPPSNAVQPANQGHQFGAKKPSAIESFFGKGKPSEPPAPPARPRTPEEIKASQMAMARLCERRGEQDQAEAIYQGLVAKYPQDPTPHHRLGVLAVQKGKFAEAEAHFRTAERLAPPSADLLSDLGYMYYLQHRLPESEATLRQALVRDPQHMAATNNLALTVGAQGRFDEALTLFRRHGTEAQALSNLAFVFSQYGDLQRAEEAYLRALSLDNTMRPAAQAVVQVAQRRRAEEQLLARRAIARQEPPEDTAERPRTPQAPPLATVAEGRPTDAAARRVAATGERPAATRPPERESARPVEEPAMAGQPTLAATDRQPLSAAGDPVEPDVAEVEVSEPPRRPDAERAKPLPAVRVAAQPREPLVHRTSFESAMAELEAALTQRQAERAEQPPAPADPQRVR